MQERPLPIAQGRIGTSSCSLDIFTNVYSTARLASRNNLFQWVGPISRGYWSAFALDGFNEKFTKADDLKTFRIGVVRNARADYLRGRSLPLLLESDRDRDNPAKLTELPRSNQ